MFLIEGAMADTETSVVITAQTDGLQSGMEAASSSVQAATEGMKAQFANLGAAAQQAQAQIAAAAAQIGTTINTLQSKVSSLAGSIGSGMVPNIGDGYLGSSPAPSSSRRQPAEGISGDTRTTFARSAPGGSSGGAVDNSVAQWSAQLQGQLLDERAFFRDSKAEELAFWQEKLALTEQGSRARMAVESNIYQLERQLAVQNERDALAMFDAEEKISNAVYARKKSAIQADAELGRISANQELVELQGLLESKWALDQDYFAKKLAAAENDANVRQRLTEQERLAYEKFLIEKQKLDVQAAQNSQRVWLGLMQPIQRAFDTSITGMILGTTTLQKAVANITQSIIGEFVSLGVKMVTNWIASELAMTTATEAGAAARTAAEGEGLAAGLAIKGLNAIKSIVTDSAQAFGGIFAFLAPIMGPAAAGPAAAGEATVLAAASGIASAAGGWVVPSDQLAMVHQNEMILPAKISQGLQGMISDGGGGGAGPVVVNISAIDSQDVKRFFHSNGSLLVSALNKAMRNGSALRTA
jgi:hypothetical protein